MDQEKTCTRCGYFNRFYIYEATGYKRTEYGRCMKEYKTKTECESCAKFVPIKRPKLSQRVLHYKINALLTDLSEIRARMEAYYGADGKDEDV